MIILFSGPSGSGKTTLCNHLQKVHNLNFISTSSKTLWSKHGITTHSQIIQRSNVNPKWGIAFQWELLEYREHLYNTYGSFCSDRSPLDNAAYFLLQNAHWATQKETGDYIERCFALAEKATKIILLKGFEYGKVPDDGMRISNQYYQDVYDTIMNMVIGCYSKSNIWELTAKSQVIRKETLNIFIEGLRNAKEKRSIL